MDFQGTFLWNELMTPDIEKAKAFYAAVAGWTYVETQAPDGTLYVLANLPGRDMPVAGLAPWPAEEPGANDWMPYLGVADLQASLKALTDAGGRVLRPLITVPGTGDIALVADVTGTVFGLLQPEPM